MADRYPFPLNMIRAVFPIYEKLYLQGSINWAGRLFLTPVRFGFTEKETAFLPRLQQSSFIQNGNKIRVYSMGEGPAVICLHGWSGRSLQYRLFAEALVASGYRFVAFDAIGHGLSEGKLSGLFDFAEGLRQLLEQEQNVKAIIGHSLGAASSSYFASHIGQLPALVSICAPVVATEILDSFTSIINASEKIQFGIRQKAIEKYGVSFEDVVMENTFSKVACPTLAVHGMDDKDVPHQNLDVLKAIRPDLEIRKYEGIGHRRILKDERVIKEVIEWIDRLS